MDLLYEINWRNYVSFERKTFKLNSIMELKGGKGVSTGGDVLIVKSRPRLSRGSDLTFLDSITVSLERESCRVMLVLNDHGRYLVKARYTIYIIHLFYNITLLMARPKITLYGW